MSGFDWEKDSAPADAPQAFDWERESAPDETPALSEKTARARGMRQGLTQGFGDELSGVIQTIGGTALEGLSPVASATRGAALLQAVAPESLGGGGMPLGQAMEGLEARPLSKGLETYRQYRDAERNEDKAAAEAHPGTYAGSEFAGNLLGSFALPGGGLGAAVGGGAAAGLGHSEADLTRSSVGNLAQAAEDTGRGGALGAAGYGAGKALTYGAGKLAGGVSTLAGLQGGRATGLTLKEVRQMGGVKPVAKFGNALIEEGVIHPFSNVEEVAERAEPLRQKAGDAIRQTLQGLDQAAVMTPGVGGQAAALPINGHAIADRIEQEVIAPLAKYSPNRGIVAALQRETDALRSAHGEPLTFEAAEGLKRSLDPLAHWERGMDPGLKPQTEAFRRIQDVVRTEVERQAQAVDPALAQSFGDMKDAYGLFAPAARIAADKAGRLQANRAFSPSSQGLGAAEAAGSLANGDGGVSAGLKGAAVAVVNKLLLERGNSAMAVGLNRLAKLMENPARLGRFAQPLLNAAARGGNSLLATHAVLLKDPEYQRALMDESSAGRVP